MRCVLSKNCFFVFYTQILCIFLKNTSHSSRITNILQVLCIFFRNNEYSSSFIHNSSKIMNILQILYIFFKNNEYSSNFIHNSSRIMNIFQISCIFSKNESHFSRMLSILEKRIAFLSFCSIRERISLLRSDIVVFLTSNSC